MQNKNNIKNKLRIAIAQINLIAGDISNNTKKIIKNILEARDKQKADIVVFPELALTGYMLEDLFFRKELYKKIDDALKKIKKIKNIYIILGIPTIENGEHFNTAIVIYNGKTISSYHKQLLPNSGVFDEKRYFTPGTKNQTVTIKGVKIALLICYDVWSEKIIFAAKKLEPQLIISLNSSPFDIEKHHFRKRTFTKLARKSKLPIIYANRVGAEDDLIFDGGSLVINQKGEIAGQAQFFSEELMLVDILKSSKKITIIKQKLPPKKTTEKLVYQALILGIKDYVEKNKINGVIIGNSGGIDSTLTLAIAVDALGKERVESAYLPSRYSSKLSGKIAAKTAKLLGIKHRVISIEPIFKSFLHGLSSQKIKTLTKENIQARCRGVILMALANEKERIVLATGNKSEMAVGYATLYGDTVGGFFALKDVYKTLVYKLAIYRNKISPVIPKEAITRAPSAELAKNQKDTDTLPSYPVLDKILERYIELEQPIDKIIAAGFSKKLATKVINMVDKSEFKRRQAAPGIKITVNSFGRERRYPITARVK